MIKKFTCGCCAKEYPINRLEVHHKCPRFLGGSDDASNLIDLCEACHHMIHQTSNVLFKGKNPSESVLAYFEQDKSAAKRCIDLAGIIVEAKRNNEDAHREYSQPVVPIEYEYYQIHVKDAAKSQGLTVAEFMASAVIEKTNQVLGLGRNHHKKPSTTLKSGTRNERRY
ncbi:HNH endonuclease [Salmonella enterica]|nr:HNH endonuclease [Salmonella enterica]